MPKKEMTEEELEEIRKKMDGPDPLDEAFKEVGVTNMDVEVAKYQGSIGEIKTFVDHNTRLEAAREYSRLKGNYPAEKRVIEGDLTVTVINYADKDKEE
jgi:hypothetical protein